MREEQQSLSSVQTVSVRQLLQDRTVRWQVLSVVVINVGMQLSGIDAVSTPASWAAGQGRAWLDRADSPEWGWMELGFLSPTAA